MSIKAGFRPPIFIRILDLSLKSVESEKIKTLKVGMETNSETAGGGTKLHMRLISIQCCFNYVFFPARTPTWQNRIIVLNCLFVFIHPLQQSFNSATLDLFQSLEYGLPLTRRHYYTFDKHLCSIQNCLRIRWMDRWMEVSSLGLDV